MISTQQSTRFSKPDITPKPCQFEGRQHLCSLGKTELRCPYHKEPVGNQLAEAITILEKRGTL